MRRLKETICTETYAVLIYDRETIYVNGRRLGWLWRFSLAVADGFASIDEMTEWFRMVHGLPFHGTIIRWR